MAMSLTTATTGFEVKKTVYNLLQADIETEYKELEESLSQDVQSATWSEIYREKGLRKPTLLSIGVMYFQKFSGIPFAMFYAKPVFIVSISLLNPVYCTIIKLVLYV